MLRLSKVGGSVNHIPKRKWQLPIKKEKEPPKKKKQKTQKDLPKK